MCDTMVRVTADGVLFAKNSDRDANEAQVLEWQPRQAHPAGSRLRCTWVEIPQAAATHAVLLSRPFWMWGAEMGTNEFSVTIGNEAVFTRRPRARIGLTGMDLLRLALERAASAEQAVGVITELLGRHGQGGGCGHENRRFSYHNSFLIADPRTAFVLETAGSELAVEEVAGARSLSNVLSIPAFARAHGDRLKTAVAAGRQRQARTGRSVREARGLADLMSILRDHGPGDDGRDHEAPVYRTWNGTLGAPCMHGGGLIASSVTTASWVAELRPDGVSHWVTATAAPCLSLFKPVRLEQPLDLGPAPADRVDGSLWWQHERLHRRVLVDPVNLGGRFLAERDALEQRWLSEPPDPATAFAEHRRRIERWLATAGVAERDRRPWQARRYWRTRERRAG